MFTYYNFSINGSPNLFAISAGGTCA